MVISMTRRTEADCDVGHHAAVFDSCWSHADADASEFRGAAVCVFHHYVCSLLPHRGAVVGGYSGTEYEVHPASNRYYDLMDLGTFGFGLRSSQCRVRVEAPLSNVVPAHDGTVLTTCYQHTRTPDGDVEAR